MGTLKQPRRAVQTTADDVRKMMPSYPKPYEAILDIVIGKIVTEAGADRRMASVNKAGFDPAAVEKVVGTLRDRGFTAVESDYHIAVRW